MPHRTRRNVLKTLASLTPVALNWSTLPRASAQTAGGGQYDAVIIGAGLGGLSCAAAFARQGFKPLVIEQHDKPGGYATIFQRGDFTFDVSLHSTTVGERNGVRNLIPNMPEIHDVEFVPHKSLYRAIFPEHDIRVPLRDVPAYSKMLAAQFPAEEAGIRGLLEDMRGVAADINRFSTGQVNMANVPKEFPHLFRSLGQTWGTMMDARIKDPKLRAIVSALWGYYGLPPSQLASFYYALPTYSYLAEGGYYPVGRSQKISNAMVAFITARGGKVLLNTRVDKVLVKDGAAYGVKTADGTEYKAKVVVSNANPHTLFHSMVEDGAPARECIAKMEKWQAGLSSFQVFLGLKKDLVRQLKIEDSEIFVETGYDMEAGYRRVVQAEVEDSGFGLTLYDNLYSSYSPKGKNTLSIITLQGYDHWQKFEADYRNGEKNAYRAEKERIADILIAQVEKRLMPGLRKAIAVKEIGTPLTNWRYTGNYRGAIYGWDQTLDNSGMRRAGFNTPIKKLYLASAWTRPGGGYGGVLSAGVQCFGEIMKSWS